MDHFAYRDGQLYCEEIAAGELADQVGTPAYVYSERTILDHYSRLAEAFAELDPVICYSIKSCGNVHICKLLAEQGSGFDVVSGGELFRALQAGADPAKITFAGVGKTDREINEAIDAGIGLFNVESEAELANITRIARERQTQVRAALRINPDVDPKTHKYTTTGKRETKFGVDLERARRAFEDFGRDKYLRLIGVHLHIGSPVNSVEPYVEAITKALALIDELGKAGFELELIDIGGGFGASYWEDQAPLAADYAKAIVPLLRGKGLRVVVEPGRSIIGNAGILLTRVQYLKSSGDKQFVIVDAAMNDLIRPSLYQAFHFIWPVCPAGGLVAASREEDLRLEGTGLVDVVGPICETGDFLGLGRHLPAVQRGDVLAVFTAGAYGFAMASQYNARPRPPEVLVCGADYRIIRRRETYGDLIAAER
ncbi:MAG: diaminopimelate decarboxylase [Phycisphaerae bacterium]|nr:diaminopimelate decarboxylase [Phycisphaerae bacterium]